VPRRGALHSRGHHGRAAHTPPAQCPGRAFGRRMGNLRRFAAPRRARPRGRACSICPPTVAARAAPPRSAPRRPPAAAGNPPGLQRPSPPPHAGGARGGGEPAPHFLSRTVFRAGPPTMPLIGGPCLRTQLRHTPTHKHAMPGPPARRKGVGSLISLPGRALDPRPGRGTAEHGPAARRGGRSTPPACQPARPPARMRVLSPAARARAGPAPPPGPPPGQGGGGGWKPTRMPAAGTRSVGHAVHSPFPLFSPSDAVLRPRAAPPWGPPPPHDTPAHA
jgi:hypothetical protein